MYYQLENGSIILHIRVKPSSHDAKIVAVEHLCIGSIIKCYLVIQINAPKQQGRANKQLTDFLSKALKLPKSHITLASGSRSVYKRIKLACNASEITGTIQQLLDNA